jgi:hypothetical protein
MTSRTFRLTYRRAAIAATLLGALAVSLAGWAAGKGKSTAEGDKEALAAANGEMVHISLQTVPARKALVKWGGKSLGFIPAPKPLVIERPRDSGPLDLVIRATGYLPVHTRVYTFSDSRASVKLTQTSEKSKLFGYRQEPAPNPDAGVPGQPPSPSPAPALPGPPAPPAPPTP